jgi:hypothetical protein
MLFGKSNPYLPKYISMCPVLDSLVEGVMNNTCIYLRDKGPNIYMYMRGRIYKESPGGIQ